MQVCFIYVIKHIIINHIDTVLYTVTYNRIKYSILWNKKTVFVINTINDKVHFLTFKTGKHKILYRTSILTQIASL